MWTITPVALRTRRSEGCSARATRSRARARRSGSSSAPSRSSVRRSSIVARAARTASACGAWSSFASSLTAGRDRKPDIEVRLRPRIVAALSRLCDELAAGAGERLALREGVRRVRGISSISAVVGRVVIDVVRPSPGTSSMSGVGMAIEIDVIRPELLALARRQHGVVTSAQLAAPGGAADGSHGPSRARLAAAPAPRRLPRRAGRGGARARDGRRPRRPRLAPVSLPSRRSPRPAPGTTRTDAPHRPPRRARTQRADHPPRDAPPRGPTLRHGIPVTSAARTLLDLAATEPPSRSRPGAQRSPNRTDSSQTLPSMSSSAVTHGTEARRR